eukprot:TRINITY_DN4813_c0_g1_i1.p1 TRINITY_DN4813_c0_g1~~TRINITY_DN4813_c0_g1_i1.p1  ORF type:complete len:324 (+),score=61.19 TRINITY_DN4813_c0_g1_i1:95-1066(+)
MASVSIGLVAGPYSQYMPASGQTGIRIPAGAAPVHRAVTVSNSYAPTSPVTSPVHKKLRVVTSSQAPSATSTVTVKSAPMAAPAPSATSTVTVKSAAVAAPVKAISASTPAVEAASVTSAACSTALQLAATSSASATAGAIVDYPVSQASQEAAPESQLSVYDQAQKAKNDILALIGPDGLNRAYYERLAKEAEQSALKGYGVNRGTRTITRTQVTKTTQVTDPRTGKTTTDKEAMAFVDEHFMEGAPVMTGVGLVCARGQKSGSKFADGTIELEDHGAKAKALFFANGFEAGPTYCKTTDNFNIDGFLTAARERVKAQRVQG